jgi:hypothetical protein
MARPHRRALAFLGFWVRQLLAAHRESVRWSISLHYRIASLQGWIAWIGGNLRCQVGIGLAAGMVPSVAALGPAGACDHPAGRPMRLPCWLLPAAISGRTDAPRFPGALGCQGTIGRTHRRGSARHPSTQISPSRGLRHPCPVCPFWFRESRLSEVKRSAGSRMSTVTPINLRRLWRRRPVAPES